MKGRGLFLLVLVLFFLNNCSAFLISDQGTNVRSSSDRELLNFGNLTIKIYDSPSGGNLIFESTLQNAIINGSWNVMINPNLEYGKNYWKDYEINGESLSFDGNDRIEFQSPVGFINNASMINLSLIQGCESGSYIRSINTNGSVECEKALTGQSENQSNLSNYALKNQSVEFLGNISTNATGFFGFLGNIFNRITKIFVKDLDVSNNINVSGNVTSSYFIGDGSKLTGLNLTETEPKWTANYSLYNTSWTSTPLLNGLVIRLILLLVERLFYIV